MKTFVLMTKLSPEFLKNPKLRAAKGRTWLDKVRKSCPKVKFLSHYALLGNFDFMDIYEAPDEETAAKVSLISLANGATSAESWTAIPYKQYLKLIKQL